MKRLQVTFFSFLFLLLMSGCSNMQIGFEEDSPFYDGGVVYIYLDENASEDTQYRVYINNEDSEVRLLPGAKARFGIEPEDIKIDILKGRQSATIDLKLEKSKSYYLKVQESNDGRLEIIEVNKSAFEHEDKKEAVDENIVELKNVEDIKEGETEFYYDPNE